MRILCPTCSSKMRVIKSQQVSKEVREAYSDCLNVDCGARAVMLVSLSHYVRPPAADFNHMISAYLAHLPNNERKAVLAPIKDQGELVFD